MRDRVWEWDRTVGTVDREQRGLYWEFRSALQTDRTDFVRLYLHFADRSIRLGLYERRESGLTLTVRISLRAVGAFVSPYAFTIRKEPFLPPEAFPDPALPFCAALHGDARSYRIPYREIDDRTLPYFCFFRPMEGDCVLLTLDRNGEPVSQ